VSLRGRGRRAPDGCPCTDASAPTHTVTIRSVYADGDTVIVPWDGCRVANDPKPYENSYAWVMRMHEGKAIDGTAF
jgi:uncharacterized protein